MRILGFAVVAAALAIATPTLADQASVLAFLHQSLGEDLKAERTKVYLGFADLNGDGKDEAVAYITGPYWCGSGGCNAHVLTPEGDSWREVGNTTVSSLPIGMLDSKTNGWNDVTVSWGSAMESGIGQMKFDGDAYARNPTSAPRAKDIGTIILAEDAEPIAP